MGAFLVSKHYVLSFDTQDPKKVHSGLGLLPIQTLCHWNIEKKKKEKIALLESVSSSLILTLDETQFTTFHVA